MALSVEIFFSDQSCCFSIDKLLLGRRPLLSWRINFSALISAGSSQQLIAGQHGLITLPVTSNLAQQLLAANVSKRQHQQQPLSSQQINVVTAQQLANQNQLSVSQQLGQSHSNQSPATHHILNTQQIHNSSASSAVQLPSNSRSSNVQIGQLLANQSAGTTGLQVGQVSGGTVPQQTIQLSSHMISQAAQATRTPTVNVSSDTFQMAHCNRRVISNHRSSIYISAPHSFNAIGAAI